jgi:hypothetical protein
LIRQEFPVSFLRRAKDDTTGSTTIVMTDPAAGTPRVLNRPSGGTERRLGNTLGIVVGKK